MINGRIYLKEHYQNGLRHGLIIFYYKSDSIDSLTKERTLNFTNGLKNGVARTYNPNGTISSEGEFLMGKIHGESKKYYSNGGLLSLENYWDGKKHGENIWFNSEGDTFQISNFVNGKNIGLQKIFKNGMVAEMGFYCDLDSVVTDTTIMINRAFGIVEEEVLIKDGKWVYYDEYQSGKIVECWDCGRKVSCDELDGE